MASAATAPDLIFNPPTANVVCYRTFTADTDSVFIIRELRSFLAAENYNGFELQLSPSAYERAEAYLEFASSVMKLIPPEFTPDGDGGIDIEWDNQGRRLALNLSKSGEGDFISWREPNGRYEGGPASKILLVTRLLWLTGWWAG